MEKVLICDNDYLLFHMIHTISKIIKEYTYPILCIFILISPSCNSPGIGTQPPGPKWKVFTTANSGLHNDTINNIRIAYNQRVYFSTVDGIDYFDHRSWGRVQHDSLYTISYYGGNKKYITYPVHDIIDAKDHAIWICLPNRVIRFAEYSGTNVWTSYSYPDLKPSQFLACAANRSNQTVYGDVWIAGFDGISRFHQGVNETGLWSNYQASDGVTPFPSADVLVAEWKPDDYSTCFGMIHGGVLEAFYNESGILDWKVLTPPRDPGMSIYSIGFADLEGGSVNSIWLGRDTDVVVFHISTATWATYSSGTTGGRMPHARVNAIATNYARQRWFGTNLGLVRFDNDTSWTIFTMANSVIPSDTITALRFDASDNLWIGTINGVAVYNPNGITF